MARTHLPKGFRYAGIISMAGAFGLKANTPLTFKSTPAPIMFFHGAKDQLVTYDEHQGAFSGYGPVYYLRKYPSPEFPKWFVDYPEGDHIVAGTPFVDCQHEIEAFLKKLVKERQKTSIHMVIYDMTPKTFGNFLKVIGDASSQGKDPRPRSEESLPRPNPPLPERDVSAVRVILCAYQIASKEASLTFGRQPEKVLLVSCHPDFFGVPPKK